MCGSAAVAFALLASPVKVCLVASLFHVPCPGCGLTRAAFAMGHGDFARAFALHPLSLVLVPMLAWFASLHALRYVQTGSAWSGPPTTRTKEILFAALGLLLVIVWLARLAGYLGGPVPV